MNLRTHPYLNKLKIIIPILNFSSYVVIWHDVAGQTGGPFNPILQTVVAMGLENIIRGIVTKTSSRIDLKYADEVRDIRRNGGVIDLLALDIHRGRINGIPNYAALVKTLGNDHGIYSSPNCPSELESDPAPDPIACFTNVVAEDNDNPSEDELEIAEKLQQLYEKVLNVDAIIGLLAEPHLLEGVSFSENLVGLMADQFKKCRDGDRLWFENVDNGVFSSEEIAEIRGTTMKDLFVRNFNISFLPDNVFARGDKLNQTVEQCPA